MVDRFMNFQENVLITFDDSSWALLENSLFLSPMS